MILTIIISLCIGVTVWTQERQPAHSKSDEMLALARRYAFQARAGNYSVVPKAVSQLEEATVANPKHSELWRALGDLHALQAGVAVQPGEKFNLEAALSAFQRGAEAYERALQLDAHNAAALSGHGVMVMALADLQQKPELAMKGFDEVNRAVELSPSLLPARLNRAFLAINLPAQVRNTPAVTEDLNFLITYAEGSRAGDVVRLLLGDLYAETGNAEFARKQYEAAAKPASKTRKQARARLLALKQGAVPAAEILRLRSGIVNCVMCHAR